MHSEFVETYRQFEVEAFHLDDPREIEAHDGFEEGYHARRGRLHVISPTTSDDSLRALHHTVDALIDPKAMRDVDSLN
jgi:hypothetical protein